jgi:hypothetical protein
MKGNEFTIRDLLANKNSNSNNNNNNSKSNSNSNSPTKLLNSK